MSVRMRRYSVLATVYAIGLVFGIREYMLSRAVDPVSWPSDEWSGMTDVVAHFAPDHPDSKWLQSQEALGEGDAAAFAARLEEAIAAGTKDNEFLLHDYAQLLLDRKEDHRTINQAVNRWRGTSRRPPRRWAWSWASARGAPPKRRFWNRRWPTSPGSSDRGSSRSRTPRVTSAGSYRWRFVQQ